MPTTTDYIPAPDGKKIAVTISSGEDFMGLSQLHFLLDPDEAPFHAPPRDIRPPPETRGVPNTDQKSLTSRVCTRCLAIDLKNPPPLSAERDWGDSAETRKQSVEETLSTGGTQIEGHVCVLGQFPEDFSISTCPLCQTLTAIRTRLLSSPLGISPWPYELHVVSSVYVHFADPNGGVANLPRILESREIADTVIFAVDPKPPHIFFYARVGFWLTEHSGTSGHLYPVVSEEYRTERRFSGRQLQTDHIDYAVLRAWIDSCRTFHQEACAPAQSDFEVPCFMLVDCYTRKVVPASTKTPYVTLSYVWGLQLQSTNPGPSYLPVGTLVLVIEDAITVTKRLGLRYLWVDQYCIRQDDLQVKMEQIQNMDAVYDRAEVAIIAAAGEDASFGLPGVSRRHRVAQPSVQAKDQIFVSSGPHLRDLLRLSKWASRGWTYQEGLLSKRRIIFTDYQVYFECSSSHCCEAIDAPADVLFQNRSISEFHPMASRSFRVFPLNKPVAKPHQILNRIQDYASKELTYNSDTLNGILGILAVSEKQIPSTAHFWGIPILIQTATTSPRCHSSDSPANMPKPTVRDQNQALLFGLRWSIVPSKRNPGFPSWSWIGWVGPLQLYFPSAEFEYAIPEICPRADFWIEKEDGSLIAWPEFHADRIRGRLLPASHFLHIEGPAVKLLFRFGRISGKSQVDPHRQERYGLYVFLQINDLQISICPLEVTRLEDDEEAFRARLQEGTWDAVILSYKGSSLPPEIDVLGQGVEITYERLVEQRQTDFELLVLESVEDAYERIGTVKLVFPERLELPSEGLLKIERRRFRIG